MKFLACVLLSFSSLFTLSTAALADGDHGVGLIATPTMNLSYIDHVLSGRIGDRPVYARPLTDEFGMALFHRAGGKDFESIFKKDGEQYKGVVESIDHNGQPIEAEFIMTAANGQEGTITGTINELPFTVQLSAETMEGHHYVSPHFAMTIGDKSIGFDMKDGTACVGCSVKLSFAIISMLFVSGSL